MKVNVKLKVPVNLSHEKNPGNHWRGEKSAAVIRWLCTKSLAYTSLVRPVLEYGSVFWDPCREGQINASDRVQKEAAEFTVHMKDCDWETLAQQDDSMLMRTYAYSGEQAWKTIRDRFVLCIIYHHYTTVHQNKMQYIQLGYILILYQVLMWMKWDPIEYYFYCTLILFLIGLKMTIYSWNM